MATEDNEVATTDATDRPSASLTPRDPLGRFVPGVSGNLSGRPASEREFLAKTYGADGRKVFERLEALRHEPETSRRLKAQIDMFLIERQFGKAAQLIGVEGGPSLVDLLAQVTARQTAPPTDQS